MPWRIEREDLGRDRNDPGDGFRQVFRSGSSGIDGRAEWFEATEVFVSVEAKDNQAYLRDLPRQGRSDPAKPSTA